MMVSGGRDRLRLAFTPLPQTAEPPRPPGAPAELRTGPPASRYRGPGRFRFSPCPLAAWVRAAPAGVREGPTRPPAAAPADRSNNDDVAGYWPLSGRRGEVACQSRASPA